MKIDIYAHLAPPIVGDLICNKNLALTRVVKANPAVYDLDTRFRIMDRYPDVVQVLTVPGASPEELADPEKAVDLAKRINDDMAELIFKYPERFASAVAVLPISDIDASLKEIDRAVNELKMRGILLRIPINGKPVDSPEFMPLYQKMCQLNLPIWWHPESSPQKADYPGETESKYRIWHLWGLIWETTVSMTRLVMSGVMEKLPKLKIITHHCGAMVPNFSERIKNHYNASEMRSQINYKIGLTEAPVDYFRRFYADTAILGNTPALMSAYHFYGTEHVLFGTDAPFDTQLGDYVTRHTIEAIEQMDISDQDRKKIFEDNARQLLRLPV
jgi:predicted TIM-barrel fold metal-dependent hydrolase